MIPSYHAPQIPKILIPPFYSAPKFTG